MTDNPQQSTQHISTIFYGRNTILSEIVYSLTATEPMSFSLIGARWVGKSALLKQVVRQVEQLQNQVLTLVVQLDCARGETAGNLLELAYVDLMQQRQTRAKFEAHVLETPPQGDAARRLLHLVRQLKQQGLRFILLLDNFTACFAAPVGDESEPIDLLHALHHLMGDAQVIVTTTQPLYDVGGLFAKSPLPDLLTQRFIGLLEPEGAASWLAAYQQQFPTLQSLNSLLLDLTGQHPFLLRKLGDSLAELQQMAPHGQTIGLEQAPLLRLRLAEHGRPLFIALWHTLQNPPPSIDPIAARGLLEQLLLAPLSAKQLTAVQYAPLNWLINQAVVMYREGNSGPSYQLFSPLFTEFLTNRLALATEKTAPASLPSQVGEVETPFYEQLTKMEAALLRYFVNHSQSVISTEQLLTDVWKRVEASDRRVQEAIRRLRLQLERQTPPIGIIENERGRGYRFVPAPRLNYE